MGGIYSGAWVLQRGLGQPAALVKGVVSKGCGTVGRGHLAQLEQQRQQVRGRVRVRVRGHLAQLEQQRQQVVGTLTVGAAKPPRSLTDERARLVRVRVRGQG
eukprot:scaffold35906_cov60-Phaeocystis_antarctica.AAC.1